MWNKENVWKNYMWMNRKDFHFFFLFHSVLLLLCLRLSYIPDMHHEVFLSWYVKVRSFHFELAVKLCNLNWHSWYLCRFGGGKWSEIEMQYWMELGAAYDIFHGNMCSMKDFYGFSKSQIYKFLDSKIKSGWNNLFRWIKSSD